MTEQNEVASITFVFKDGATRVFSQEVHGDDFASIAAEFEETNKEAIASKTEGEAPSESEAKTDEASSDASSEASADTASSTDGDAASDTIDESKTE